MQRAMSMKDCVCHDRYSNLNNAEDEGSNRLSINRSLRNWSVVSMRNQAKKNYFHEDIAKSNREFMTSNRESKDYKKLKF